MSEYEIAYEAEVRQPSLWAHQFTQIRAPTGGLCLGPPCEHFPEWVRTPEEARDWLDYKALEGAPQVNYVERYLTKT